MSVKGKITSCEGIGGEENATQQRLEYLLANSPAVHYICKVKAAWTCTFVSKNVVNQLGYGPKEFCAQPGFWEEHVHPDDRQRFIEGLRQLFEKGYRVDEYRFFKKDEKYRWLHDEARLTHDENGNPVDCIGFLMDITERKKVEEELRGREADLAEAQKVAMLGSWNLDVTANRVRWSEELYRIFDVRKEEYSDMYDFFIGHVHPDDKALVLKTNRRARKTGEPFDVEYRIVTQKGRLKHIREIGHATKDATGKVIGLFGTAQDITDYKQAEEKLRESQQLLNLVLATLPVGVAVTDQAGDVVLVNEASKRIWGGMIISGRERWAKSKGFWHDSGKRIEPTDWASVGALSEGQTSLNELIDIETYDGRQKTIRNSSVPIRNTEGLIVGAVFVNEDVTAAVHAEEALRDYSRLIRAMAAHLVEMDEAGRHELSQELHDRIGQTLTALSINLNIIRGEIPDDLQRKIGPRIEDSLALVEEAVSQVRDVMADLRPPVLDDYGLLVSLRWYGKQFANRTGIAVKIRGKEASPRLALNVETVLFRITQEAFTNTSKHAKATKVVVVVKSDENALCLSIKDDGIGFHPSEKAGRGKHRGWGLITMSERAESLGGSFRIESRPKRGTKLVVKVPR
jgi:PAS domain S-box-containing protein